MSHADADGTGIARHAATSKTFDAPGAPPQPYFARYRVAPGERVDLDRIDADDTGPYLAKTDVLPELKIERERIRDFQEKLYAESKQSLLVVLQAKDTGGKDGTIKNVFRGVNAQGCQVWSFKSPSQEELSHDFLWRIHNKAPAQGMIAIFNRSHYEDVLVPRVKNLVSPEVWQARYQMINDFERMLARNNTTILKFYLHISKDEQKRRLQSRLDDPTKHWKFALGDLEDRALWDEYRCAYEDAIGNCATDDAPWYVVPANKKWYRNLVVARTIADTLEAMNPQFPAPAPGIENVVITD